MGFSTIAAMMAGTAAVEAGALLAAISTIGLEMSLVGAVTGSKGLMKLGGVMGLVGGVGGLINGAVSGAASATAESAMGLGTDASSLGAVNGMDAMSDAFVSSGASGAGGFGAEAVNGLNAINGSDAMSDAFTATKTEGSFGGWASAADDAKKALDMTDATGALAVAETPDAFTFNAAKDSQAFNPSTAFGETTRPPDASATGAAQASTGSVGNNPSAFTADGSRIPYQPDNGLYGTVTAQAPKDYFGDFLKWVKQNEKTANNLMTLGAGALKGISERSMFDEKMAMEKSRYQYGNTVANFQGRQPLIGARA